MEKDIYSYFLTMVGPLDAIAQAYAAIDTQLQAQQYGSLPELFGTGDYDFDPISGKATFLFSCVNGATTEISEFPELISSALSSAGLLNLVIKLEQDNLDHKEKSSVHLWEHGTHRQRQAILVYPTFDPRDDEAQIYASIESELGTNSIGGSPIALMARMISGAKFPALESEATPKNLKAHIEDAQKRASSKSKDKPSNQMDKHGLGR